MSNFNAENFFNDADNLARFNEYREEKAAEYAGGLQTEHGRERIPGVLKTYSPAELRAANETARAMAKARGISKAELLRQYGGFRGFLRSFRKK